ncbi:DUF1003 domain-containing protein [Kitasatospora viridis]|uniref:Putative membrane protein n=1 Tax=Kitasatospora viridis TaxID=281105 RepID=A0A561UFD9_9ACTN|nr:DUF1003 domain-containing protein [Kitasatospora viridis]TWF98072.1 putative membrane protein [Kitasatospora viridis]
MEPDRRRGRTGRDGDGEGPRQRIQGELRQLRESRTREGNRQQRTETAHGTAVRARLDQPRTGKPSLFSLPAYDPEAFGQLSERIARFLGTGRFIVWMTVVVVVWIGWNTLLPENVRFDDYPFIFLTLVLSLQASYAAPLILLAQNRQDDRDRVNMEQDRARAERSIADTEYLTREVAALRQGLGEVATRDFVRSELQSLLKELDERRETAELL